MKKIIMTCIYIHVHVVYEAYNYRKKFYNITNEAL